MSELVEKYCPLCEGVGFSTFRDDYGRICPVCDGDAVISGYPDQRPAGDHLINPKRIGE